MKKSIWQEIKDLLFIKIKSEEFAKIIQKKMSQMILLVHGVSLIGSLFLYKTFPIEESILLGLALVIYYLRSMIVSVVYLIYAITLFVSTVLITIEAGKYGEVNVLFPLFMIIVTCRLLYAIYYLKNIN
ncbi:MAG: hypothetical protein OEW60_00530 [Thiovulaceae bacterium]|nr:hypothetical protein [Sulfurimonadaceae bacterium]